MNNNSGENIVFRSSKEEYSAYSETSAYSATSDEEGPYEWGGDGYMNTKFPKPDIPYVELIVEALESAAPKKMLTLTEIYKRIMMKHPYFKTAPSRWRNSIRHNLSLHPRFARVAQADKSKGSFWKFATGDSNEEPKPQSSLKMSNSKRQMNPRILAGYKQAINFSRVQNPENSRPIFSVKHPASFRKKQKKVKIKKKKKHTEGYTDFYDDDSSLSPSLRCWSPIAQISRLSSAGESDDEKNECQQKRGKLILNLDYGEDLNPVNIFSYLDNLKPVESPVIWFKAQNSNQRAEAEYGYSHSYYKKKYWILPQYNYAAQCNYAAHYQAAIPRPSIKSIPIAYPSVRKINNAGNRLSDQNTIFCSE
ncbi:hypothetical protein MDAP_001662 [Mitosporidium daphniae]